jgi:hypothetical protein
MPKKINLNSKHCHKVLLAAENLVKSGVRKGGEVKTANIQMKVKLLQLPQKP